MTKIKNTKKGMAKKTLSISLAVAMLATSNVPVWAAEDLFTDGTIEAVEAPVEDVFTDATEEVVEETPEVEAPAVEENEAVEAQSLVYDDSALAKIEAPEWGNQIDIPTNAIVYNGTEDVVNGTLLAYWMYNGKQVARVSNDFDSADELGLTFGLVKNALPELTKEDCLDGGNFSLRIRIEANGTTNFDKVYNFGAAKKVNLDKEFEEGLATYEGYLNFIEVEGQNGYDDYNGKEHKPSAVLNAGQSYIDRWPVSEGVYDEFKVNDFSWDYVRTLPKTGSNDLISADAHVDNEKMDIIAKLTVPGYEGTIHFKNAYAIGQKDLTAHAKKDLDVKLTKKEYEFTGDYILPATTDVSVLDKETKDDLSAFVSKVFRNTNAEGAWEVSKDNYFKFQFDFDKPGVIGNYYAENNSFAVAGENGFDIIKRNLENCTFELIGDYTDGELIDMGTNPNATKKSFEWGKELKVYDANGEELTELYTYLENSVKTEDNNTKFYLIVKPTSVSPFDVVAKKNIEDDTIKQAITPVRENSLRNCKVYFLNEDNSYSELVDGTITEYTGKPYELSKKDIVIVDFVNPSTPDRLGDHQYELEFDQNTDAGKHWIKIVGGSGYRGSSIIINYEVSPAKYSEHDFKDEVAVNSAYTKPEDYANAINFSVVATNDSGDKFTLKPEDMIVEYKFVGDREDRDGNKNLPHNSIEVKATITNENFLGGKAVIEETVALVHPSIADANVEIIGEYTFTGEKVIPEVKVTAANGKVLKEGVDYRLDVKHGLHATDKAELEVIAIRECESEESKAIYEKDSVYKEFFTIKPADISKLVATEEFEYKGEAWTPATADLGLELDKKALDTTFFSNPKKYVNNVNAGTATATIAVKEQWKGDFTADTVDVDFVITPFTYEGEGDFIVYLENGHAVDFKAFEGFKYDGTEQKFMDADYIHDKFDLGGEDTNNYSLKKGTDYTIEYDNNIYPDPTGKDGKTATVYAKLSDNFRIDTGKTENGEPVYTNVLTDKEETAFRILKSAFAEANVTVSNPEYNLGKKVEPTVVVTVDGKTLVEDTDYTVSYNKDVAYTAGAENKVVITGINGYVASKVTKDWTVEKKSLKSDSIEVILDKTSYKPGEEPEVTVVDGKTIIDAEEYTVAYTDKEAGKLTITAADKNYTDEIEVTYEVAARADLADATVIVAPVKETGAQVTPDVTVKFGNKVLEKDVDYTVTYGENIEAGEGAGSVTITAVEGSVDYKGEKTVNFDIIAKADLADAEVSAIADMEATGEQLTPVVTVKYGKTLLAEGEDYTVTYGENTEVGEGTVTITAVEGNADYKGEKTVKFNIVEPAPEVGQAMIDRVDVVNNRITVVLTGEADDAEGYDYVISTVEDYKNGRLTNGINKNQVATQTTYQYLDRGVYYAYCHAWKRDENGKKVFGEWSNIERFEINVDTPSQPVITDFTVEGNTVTVNYKGSADALGYDVVLGSTYGKVYGEKRPLQYGDKVIKNAKGFSVTFTDVEPGTYYAGLHAYNRTAADSKKVFSPWSNIKTITVE